MDATAKYWCDEDDHHRYEHFADFNEWFDGEEGQDLREQYGLGALTQPSKAFYAGDRAAYDQAFQQYQIERRHEVLGQRYFEEQFTDDHWYRRNQDRFLQLVTRMATGQVVPFVGAGVSVAAGYPSWKDHLREQGRTAGMDPADIEKLLAAGRYEAIIEDIENQKGRDVFVQEIRDVFSRAEPTPEVLWRITELFENTIITTNYDRLIERAYDSRKEHGAQIINGTSAGERAKPGQITVYKLHGDVEQATGCILGKNQYDDAYGNGTLDMARQLPKLLTNQYKNSSLLFLGSSLNEDRTVRVFRQIKATLGDAAVPQHFAIEQAPEDEQALADRNSYLAGLGITPIWFEKGCFESVESILQLVKNELGYLGVFPGIRLQENESEPVSRLQLDVELSHFLGDFVDLMPLLYWLHRHVPAGDTEHYLRAMQRVFYAGSLFTDETDSRLLTALDHIARALANRPDFDGYTEEKLKLAFGSIQAYMKSIGEANHADDSSGWDLRELLVIPLHQLEGVIAGRPPKKSQDHTVIRLISALLNHGLNQARSPVRYCELPTAVNAELGDYLTLVIPAKLGVRVPDRLASLSDHLQDLCSAAWSERDQPVKLSFIKIVQARLGRILK